jgi:hypothetical protein
MEPWAHILASKNYTGQDTFLIQANDIKKAKSTWTGAQSQFEPRLLAYMSSSSQRPTIFQEKGLYLLPVRNGTYLLTKTNIYKQLTYTATTPTPISKDTSSLILRMGESETSLIDNLRYSKVFERPDFLNEPITHGPLLNGRHRCDFDMNLGGSPTEVRGVQFEVDSCYESQHKILLIEGKSGPKAFDSFNIRQLYYPYRAIRQAIGTSKEIVCLFIHKLGNTIHIWKYAFPDSSNMNSIVELGHYTFQFV